MTWTAVERVHDARPTAFDLTMREPCSRCIRHHKMPKTVHHTDTLESMIHSLDDIISVLQRNSLRRYGHALRKEDNDWVKKCTEYEVEGARPRGSQRKLEERLWKKTVKHRD